MKSERAFFFLRHNNDIDHITPVLYKWLSSESVPTDIIITTKRNLLDDYRIKYLKKYKNARIFHINDLFKKYSLSYIFNRFYFKYDGVLDNIFKKFPILGKIADRIIGNIADRIFRGADKGLVVFDWKITRFIQQILRIAKSRHFTSISLPHGDRPYISYLETIGDLNYSCLDSHKGLNIFDYVVVPNELCFKRHERWMEKDRIKVLGSPRYNDEWMGIISKLIEPFEADGSEGKLKIVFFLRNTNYPIFWNEVTRTIRLILQFPNIYLVVCHHPREVQRKKRRLTRKLDTKSDNLEFIYGGVSSGSLILWADLIIDLGTSAMWEAVKRGKPVLMLEYLHANYSTCAYYIKSSEIKCRDELYNTLQKFTKNKNHKFYDEKERRRFIKAMIDVTDPHVLERYSKFLKRCLNE